MVAGRFSSQDSQVSQGSGLSTSPKKHLGLSSRQVTDISRANKLQGQKGKLGIFLDTETTGLCPHQHRTLELAMKVVDLSTGEVMEEYETIIQQPREVWENSDPHALTVNGFSWDMTLEGRPEGEVAKKIKEIFQLLKISKENALFICQNPAHDRTFFAQLINQQEQKEKQWPYHWLDFASMTWALSMAKGDGWDAGTPLSKDSIAEAFCLPKEAMPHRAMNGVDHLVMLYQRIVGFPSSSLKEQKIEAT